MSCHHTRWLTLGIKEKELTLLETDRVRRLVSQITDADRCYPGLFVFFGADTKDSVLKNILASNVKERRRRGCITLHIASSNSNAPTLYASSPIPFSFKCSRSLWEPRCHQSTRSIFYGEGPLQKSKVAPLFTHILHPFSDAFCFFRSDFKSWAQLTNGLLSWLERPSRRFPKGVNPVLIIVIEPRAPDKQSEQESRRDFNRVFDKDLVQKLTTIFSRIEAVYISHRMHTKKLQDCLTAIKVQMQHERRRAGVLFSATHLEAMLRYATEMRNYEQPLNLIEFSRTYNPVPVGISMHISRFLANFSSFQELENSAVPVLASALLLDAFPPGMHDFVPADVFDVLYSRACQDACQTAFLDTGTFQTTDLVGSIRARFCHMTEHLRASNVQAAELHRNSLREISGRPYFLELQTCSVCLIRNAEPYLTLSCKHRVCETCVQIFGSNDDEHPWLFKVEECPLCDQHRDPPLVAKLRNPCRGLRILTIDGGGCRAIIPLTFLQMLQNKIDLPYPVQQNFDVTFAPSSGGFVALGLCLKGLSVEEAVQVFAILAKRAFEKPKFLGLPEFPRIFPWIIFLWAVKTYRLILACLLDSYYSATGLEEALKELFGNDLTMSNSMYATAAGLKVGIPVTTAAGCEPCLFTNYQGQPFKRDYRVILPENVSPVPVWLVARFTSAAPWFFRPKSKFQDGGLWMNNPVPLVDSEVRAIDASIKDPLVVSVGTGLSKERSLDLPIPSATSGWRTRFIPRLYDSLMRFTSGKRMWNDYQRRERAGRSLRFDVDFEGKEPSLDQVDTINEMAALAEKQFDSRELETLANALICSLFHFELESTPSFLDGHYSGNILCDITHQHPAFEPLLERLVSSSACFSFNGQPIGVVVGDGSYVDCCGNFCKSIEFQGSGDEIAITLQLDMASKAEHISGSPFSIPQRVRAQGLDAIFGEANHKKRKRSLFIREDRTKRPRLT